MDVEYAREEFRARLIAALAEIMERPSAQESDPLDPWDSLSVMSALAVIDEIYGKVVSGSALSECKTVADVLRVAEA